MENEEAFRAANERLVDAVDGAGTRAVVPFICECADDTCLGRVDLDLDTYREIRAGAHRFFRLPGHLDAPGETVISSHDGYDVVEKAESS